MKITKQCTKCLIPKSLDEFGNFSRAKDGKKTICKHCITLMNSNRYLDKKEEIKEKVKEWAAENPEKVKKIKRDYYDRNKDNP